MPLKISQTDYNLYNQGLTTVDKLCYKHNICPTQARNELKKYKGGKRSFTSEDKTLLRAELTAAVPYDPHFSVQSILARWEIRTVTQALQILKIGSMAELKLGPSAGRIKALLKQHGLRLIKGILYAPKNRGSYYTDRQLTVDLEELTKDPEEWFKKHLDDIQSVCYRVHEKIEPHKILSRHVLRRYDTATKTAEMLDQHYTVREIKKALGTSRYVTALRAGEVEDLFNDEELELLRKGGLMPYE
jgi:hypothetical protein